MPVSAEVLKEKCTDISQGNWFYLPAGTPDPWAVVVAAVAAVTLVAGRSPVPLVMLGAAAVGAARALLGA